MSNLLEITFIVFLVIFALTGIISLLSIIKFGREETALISVLPKYRAALFSSLILEVVGVIVGVGYIAADQIASATDTLARFSVERREPSMLHDYVLLRRDISRVRMLGLNGLSVLHRYRRDLAKMIQRGDTVVEMLLLDPNSDAFLDRSNLEEAAPQQSTNREPRFVSGRMRAEWEASKAILRDIVNQALHEHLISVEELSARLKIKMHRFEPDYSFLFVDTSDGQLLIHNKFGKEAQEPGTAGGSRLVVPGEADYVRAQEHFRILWEAPDTREIGIEDLRSELTSVSYSEGS